MAEDPMNVMQEDGVEVVPGVSEVRNMVMAEDIDSFVDWDDTDRMEY
jgi:hypothetical protein